MPLWDFTAAFPSISYRWIFTVLKAMRFPEGFVELIKALCHKAAVGVEAAGAWTLLTT